MTNVGRIDVADKLGSAFLWLFWGLVCLIVIAFLLAVLGLLIFVIVSMVGVAGDMLGLWDGWVSDF